MSFTETCLQVAAQFIQTVVVIDDRGFAEPPDAVVSVAAEPDDRGYKAPAPATGDTGGGAFADGSADPLVDPDPVKHGLDGRGLTRRFAAMGISCTVYVPEPGESCLGGVDSPADWTSGLLARRADIVVVDWLLDGRTSNQARNFIKHILEDDRKQGGRLRLLAVYTGADDLKAHRRDLQADLQATGISLQEDNTETVVALSGPQLRVVFLHKDHEALPEPDYVVSEGDLPLRLIKEFARLTEGIMPCVALAAISAVRDGTHNILAKFNRTLDPALAAHRSILETPSDSEGYAFGLVFEELHMRLDGARLDSFRPNAAVFEQWVDHLAAQNQQFNLPGSPGKLVAPDQVKLLLVEGTSQHERVGKKDDGSTIVGRRKVWEHLTALFSTSPAEAELANLTFARMALLRREAFGVPDLPNGWLPTLTLGAVIALLPPTSEDNGASAPRYYLCLQPICDAVRLQKARPFPLLPLDIQNASEAFSLVVRVTGGKDLRLRPKTSPYEIRMVDFAPTAGMDSVRGERDAGGLRFHAVDGSSFEWLGEMRPSAAQRVAQQLSSQFGRVGLDEFEWLRKSAGP